MIPKSVPIVPNFKKQISKVTIFCVHTEFKQNLRNLSKNRRFTSVFLERDAFIINTTFPKSTNYFNHP